jgi:signal transduction histidine kinase
VFRRIIGFVFFLVAIGVLVGGVVATGLSALSGSERWVVIGLTLLALAGFALVMRRIFGRMLGPVGELIDATRRLGDGDTGVRLSIKRPGPLAAVFGSFNRMAGRLEEEDERRRRLLADIGHELRTPMTVIRGEIEAVLDGLHPPQSLSNVIDEVDLMDRLLDDLRVLALAEAGRLQLHTEPSNLGEIARDVLNSYARRASEHAVEVELTITPGLPDIEGDAHRLHQVLANIVSNALNQMPEGGHLGVGVYATAKEVVVEVADTGPGIPEDQVEWIFERFVRAGDSSGTGLGLSISRDLVVAHGGTLSASNRTGGGAVFTVRLPTVGGAE